MKKVLISLLTLLALGIECSAQTFSVTGNVEALSSGETVSFQLHIADVTAMTSTHFEIVLPTEFSINAVRKNASLWDCMMSREGGVVSAISSSDGAFTGEGDLFTVEVVVPASTAIGSYPVVINNIRVNGDELASTVEFNINVVSTHTIILDELSALAPDAAVNVNVRVKRTIKANEWSTICLPFAMNETQMKAAFGNDVQVEDFTGTVAEFDAADNVVGIKVNFSNATSIEANHPYIIKVSTPVSEFTVDGIDIVTDEDEAYIEFDNGKTGSRRVVYSGFYGTYHAGTVLDEFTLFLNDNKFWYSAGSTKMKAFRAYFDFLDVLTSVENAASRISMSFDDETTGVSDVRGKMEDVRGDVYDLQGRRVAQSQRSAEGRLYPQSLKKGLYIKNGKKVVKK